MRRSQPSRRRPLGSDFGPSAAARVEPWRDWAVLVVVNHTMLLGVALVEPAGCWILLAGVPLGMGLSTATLTVLHDAGHRRLGRRAWSNAIAVHTAAPVGLWVAHFVLKHRVHHLVPQVYPLDEATRAGVVRLHPDAPLRRVHRYQHFYAWGMYSLAWVGELHDQLAFLRSGALAVTEVPPPGRRARSFLAEKGVCALVLTPYAVLLGPGRLALLLLWAMSVASVLAAVINVVGHINTGLASTSSPPRGGEWTTHVVRTTASFSTGNPVMRWLTGGLTHHLAHHLRPQAPRAALPGLHRTLVSQSALSTGLPVIEYPTLAAAVVGHFRQLRTLGAGHGDEFPAAREAKVSPLPVVGG